MMFASISKACCLALCLAIVAPVESADARSHHHAAAGKKHKAKAAQYRKLAKRRAAARKKRQHETAQTENSATPADHVPVSAEARLPSKVLDRDEILAADPDRLQRIGRHLIVGYEDIDAIKALVDKKAIAGIFITDHNVRNRSASAMATLVQDLQNIRRAQGMPPLIVAADQEGGPVSRLSPPLRRQPSLGKILKNLPDDEARHKAVVAYAEAQAEELLRIGITLNFSPVVDLNLNPHNRGDGETRLRLRAIDDDPDLVAKVADWYCETLAEAGVMCTLKHFPGLGRATRDTHVASVEISADEDQLQFSDWVPFRRVMAKPYVTTMLGHVRIGAIDTQTPASFSKRVIKTLIRERWQYDGLLITDDLGMGAVTRSKNGIGGAAVQALEAGADLLLVSFSEKYLDTVMSALLEADAAGKFSDADQAHSQSRLERSMGLDR